MQSFARAILFSGLAAATGAAVAQAQTTVAASLYGAFSESTNVDNSNLSPSNAAGGLFQFRHIINPLVGYEATYSYNRANQSYSTFFNSPSPACPCTDLASVSANAHQITGDWLVSLKAGDLRPFVLAGGGLLLNVPSESIVATIERTQAGALAGGESTSKSAKGVFVYGAGLDWKLLPRFGLRLQYRGNLYKAPDLVNAFSSTSAFTHTAEPVIGIYFRL